ncbi:MAG: hypothetical protein H0W64_08715 [Gammaproteobacteria bacterium]|nr:hypothetical protein [Gammaproteobacteria bacterium]
MHSTSPSTLPEKKSKKKLLIDILKKLDLDEAIMTLKGFVSGKFLQTFSSFLMGGICAAGLFSDGWESLKDLIEAYRDPNAPQRKTRIAVGATALGVGAVGGVLSLGYIAAELGLVLAGMTYLPLIIPSFMTAMCTLAVANKGYAFAIARKNEADARKAYKPVIKGQQEELNCIMRTLAKLNELKKQAIQDDKIYAKKLANHQPLSEVENTFHKHYQKAIKSFDSQIFAYTNSCETLIQKVAAQNLQATYLECRTIRLDAEREVAFATIEAGAASAVVIAMGIGITAFIATGSILSMGALPATLLLGGMAIGMGIKIFEAIDKHYDFAITNSIRNFITSTFDKFSFKVKHPFTPTPEPTMKLIAIPEKPKLHFSEKSSVSPSPSLSNQHTVNNASVNVPTYRHLINTTAPIVPEEPRPSSRMRF